ncbi:hypothetical protein DL89DRAFT_269828 [Linderina pennispora]|uniref:Cyclin-D1-binding protein 1-like N-terminal domain-containing protein n=1 Tax=Linderina pennispora TaxID=61395 RepID=A0A1Y1VZV5_9FUNG|nr:uncharacterized protein DL89DRAFT_269828 [Linderina pennispora]ORX66783.1 hypothetical protein DL89DRAFT_269828 [Linderina pennispora]
MVLLDHVRTFDGIDSSVEFSGKHFKTSIDNLATAIDKEVTRFLIALKPPALDKEIRELCPKINAGFFQLVQLLNQIPKSAGLTYLKGVTLVNTFISDKVALDKTVLAELAYTSTSGIFWEHCKQLTQIPVDNRAAVVVKWKSSVGDLVRDAVDELKESVQEAQEAQEAQKDDSAENDGYSSDESLGDFDPDIPAERLADARKAQQLVTMARLVCDKIALRCIRDCDDVTDEKNVWLDRLLELGQPVQGCVDDLVAALFIEDETWSRQMAVETGNLVRAWTITFVDDSHLKWFEMAQTRLNSILNESPVAR